MKCRNCGFEMARDADECAQCGAAPSTEECTKPEEHRKTLIMDSSTQVNLDPLGFAPGEQFGDRYQVIEEIGRGGMGRVFKAKDLELDIIVALKMINPRLSSRPDIVARFKQELLLTREIRHENIIPIHDLGEVAGIRYISMNYIQGNTLKEITQSTGKLTIEKSIDILRQICAALTAAHSRGIIHRDLKPQNIMVDNHGKVFVLDFGIARSMSSETKEEREKIILGTPDCMAPEQIKGEKADITTDIYSLGVILFELVTGTLPFTGKKSLDILRKHLDNKPPVPSKLNPLVPLKLEHIILKCMAKKQKDRFQSAAKILDQLEEHKTVRIAPIKIPPETGQTPKPRRLSRLILWPLILLPVLYAAVSLSSFLNDSTYKTKIDKSRVEYTTYYKNYFPLSRTWAPKINDNENNNEYDNEYDNENGWDIYRRLFPAGPGNSTALRDILSPKLGAKLDQIVHKAEYQTMDEVGALVADHGAPFDFPLLRRGVRCGHLDPFGGRGPGSIPSPLNLAVVLRYTDMGTLAARQDCLRGDFNGALEKLYDLMLFSVDMFAASTHMAEKETALVCFGRVCRELIPLLLAREIADNALRPHEAESLALFGTFNPHLFPPYPAPPGPSPRQAQPLPMPRMEALQQLLKHAITEFDTRDIFYTEYLNLVDRYRTVRNGTAGDVYGLLGTDRTTYRLVGKLRFRRHWFSINRYFYEEGIDYYRGLFEGMKYIGDMHNKNTYLRDYATRHADDVLIADGSRVLAALKSARTLGKLTAIIYTLYAHGPDSGQFLDLKTTGYFTDEGSGKRYQLSMGKDNHGPPSLAAGRDFKLNLGRIDYTDGHRNVLRALGALLPAPH